MTVVEEERTEAREIPTVNGGIPDGYYSRGQAAAMIGKSRDTLKIWARHKVFVPRYFMNMGRVPFSLYSEEDIKQLKQIAATRRPGRKKKT